MPTADSSDALQSGPGSEALRQIRERVQESRTKFDTTSADVVAKLETFRQGLVAAIGEISPDEAMRSLEKEAELLFNQVRPKELTHAEAVQRLIDRAHETRP